MLVAFNVEGENLTNHNVKFPNLSFAAQNVLSLNVSTKNSKTDLKILAVTKNNVDVVILSDTRLNTDKQNASIHDLTKKFLFRGYNFIHNSKSSSRGVAILIKKTLDWEIHSKKAHIGDNYLLLDITIMKKRFTLAAVYGPNNDDLQFYDTLERDISSLNNEIIIAGGDWNATLDPSGIEHNLDAINMRNIPSRRRSEKINSMARNLKIIDPFRFLHPLKKEFTFVPNIPGQKNRSRLDFFLVSDKIIHDCKIANIPHNLTYKQDF